MPDRDDERWELWGPLADRYRTERPRRILALDGGGIRGVMTLGVLARLERDLAEATGGGDDFRLCDFFDTIGGTSTGAIIAAGLARRMSVDEITDFYENFGKIAFSRRKLWMRWQSLYGDGKLANTLKETFGEETNLRPEHLACLLTVVTRNATTDSAWPVSSNPFAKYNDPARSDCNLQHPAVEARPGQHRRAGLLPARGDRVGPARRVEVVRVRGRGHDSLQQPGLPLLPDGGRSLLPPLLEEGRARSPDCVGRDRKRPGAGRDRRRPRVECGLGRGQHAVGADGAGRGGPGRELPRRGPLQLRRSDRSRAARLC